VPNPGAAPSDALTGVRLVFAGYATQIGLDVERFKRDLDTEPVKARIATDQERGISIGVDRTPFLFIDGVQIPYTSFDEKELRAVIDTALSGKTPTFSPVPSPTPAPQTTPALPAPPK
jgi:hypothetical protein